MSVTTMRQCALACLSLLLSVGLFASSGMAIKHAQNFEITQYDTHRILTVKNTFRGSFINYDYALVPKGRDIPELPKGIKVIRTPVEKVVAMETVYIGYLEALDQLDTISAAATVNFITNSKVLEGVASGAIQSVQSGQTINVEKLILLQPDLILTSVSGDANFDMPAKLERTGLPIALTAGYMEQHPLARAEWIKFVAAFLEEDERARIIFDHIEQRYLELTALTKQLDDRPTILCGAPYSSVWHVPGGESFTARMIRDAGGDYLWSNDKSQGGIPLDIERVFLKAANADYWLNPSYYRSMKALSSADKRFGKFAAAENGTVFNNTRQVSPKGGNAIWESGIVHPDEVLADLIHIFHPELLPHHELVYYEQLK